MFKLLPLALLPVLAGCAATATPAAPELVGTKWSFTTIDGVQPVSSKAQLSIEPGRIGANVGCNGLGSELWIDQQKLVTGAIVSTRMFCDGVMEQERAVGELLEADPAFVIKGDRLLLEGGGHRAELRRLP